MIAHWDIVTYQLASNVSKYLLSIPVLNMWTIFEQHCYTRLSAWASNMLRMDCRMNLDCLTEGSDEEEQKAANLVNFYEEADAPQGLCEKGCIPSLRGRY